jgi:dihydroflavonol-4-reductase
MRILVVGGTGLIGSHAARELQARGHEVVVAARRPPASGQERAAEFAALDYTDLAAHARAVQGFDALVFATGTDWRAAPREDPLAFFRRVNAQAPAHLFAAAASAGVRRSVFVTSYYHAVRTDIHDQPYIRSRVESEPSVLEACGGRMHVSIVQPSWVMGPVTGMEAVGFGELITRLMEGPWPAVCPPGGTNWVSTRSLGVAIASALEQGEHGRRYLVGDENWTWRAVFERFAELCATRKRVHVLPRSAVLATGLARSAARTLRGRRTGWSEYRWSQLLMEELFFDTNEAKRALGYPTGDIERAIRETVEHCQRLPERGHEVVT